jgi:hypothetical protein
MTKSPTDPFDPEYYMSDRLKEDTIKLLRERHAESLKYHELRERRRRRLNRLSLGLLGR